MNFVVCPARLAVGVALSLLLVSAGDPLGAADRVFRLFDQRDGLPTGEVVRLVQDRDGFIWMGSFAGLVRYDGDEMLRWAPDRLNGHVGVLIAGPDGDVLVRVEPGRHGDVDATGLYRVVASGIEPVAGPDGRPLTGVADAAFGDTGQLCVTIGAAVACRLASGAWVRHAFDDIGEEASRVARGPSGSVLVATTASLWRVDAEGSRHKIAAVPGIVNMAAHPDGSLFVTTFGQTGRVLKLGAGAPVIALDLDARPIDLAVRGDVVWASFDRYVAAISPNEPPVVIGPDEGLPSGGPLLVDHERSLWIGTYRGVMHLPEPQTVVLTDRDGLASAHTRFVAIHGDTAWVGTWQGLSQLRRQDGRWRARPGALAGRDRMCLDRAGRLWMGNLDRGLVRHSPERSVLYPNAAMHNWFGCAVRSDGTLWLSTNQGLFVTATGDGPPQFVAPNPVDPPGSIYFRQVLEDRQGQLWVAANEQVCHTAVSAVGQLDGGSWRCRTIPDARGISSMIELTDGDLWIATDRVGVWRYDVDEDTWMQMPGSTTLPSYSLRGLVASADGTVWILGHGTIARVRDDHTVPAGWTVVERLTGLHGVPSAAAEHLVERPDGSVWIATIVGLVQVPARARQVALRPPAVELVDVLVNGEHVNSSGPRWRIDTGDIVELRFAALSYRDRGLLRHQYRLREDGDWVAAPGPPSSFRFADLGAGSYSVQVRASLDGQAWTPVPASFSFEVLPPWYRQPWALAVLAAAIGAALYLAYQLRLAFLLRLERQRTRIAMDLHDEIGSGLGSINILAGLAADATPANARAFALLRDIADTAGELGASLSGIVWSLSSRSDTLEGLVSHLADRAVRLFPGPAPVFSMDVPDELPHVRLSLVLRWNVALVALEAMHNAARHSGASRVVLGLAPAGHGWKLSVEDDGRGTGDVEPGRESGVGLESMKRRAADIGADLNVTGNGAGGTTVTLVFDPMRRGRGRRP